MDKQVKDRLAQVIAANLPKNLTEDQALWWINNADFLPDTLAPLADVVVEPEE